MAFGVFSGQARGMWKFPGQGLSLRHSSDSARSLTRRTTGELQDTIAFDDIFFSDWKANIFFPRANYMTGPTLTPGPRGRPSRIPW